MIIISLGSNVTGWIKNDSSPVLTAYELLKQFNIKVLRQSFLYLTEPFGPIDQAEFTNSAISIQTSLSPLNLLTVLKRIEAIAGRRPSKKWGPRVLDLDVIDYNGFFLNRSQSRCVDFMHGRKNLVLPHPGIPFRPFVLRPIMDIAPFWHHPATGLTAAQMLRQLPINSPGKILKIIDA
jgi:2-amino-4-hydroxy-6-hydroxymethyldihydropteridine diphosphokinase